MSKKEIADKIEELIVRAYRDQPMTFEVMTDLLELLKEILGNDDSK